MISVIVTSRVQGNVNHNLEELIRSLREHSRDPYDLELLVKFDEDDENAKPIADSLKRRAFPFVVKTAWGPRGRGYIDIHHGYNQLLPMMSRDTKIVIAMADDFRAERDWDNALRNAVNDAGEYFIIHQRRHPVPSREFHANKQGDLNNFNMSNDMFNGEDLYIIDEAPAWSMKLLDDCRHLNFAFDTPGKRDMTFPVSFTDAWTICLEYVLWHEHKINITRFLPNLFISRKTCEVDQPGNPRWSTDRKINFDYIKSPEFKSIVELQAEMISCHLKEQAKV